MKIHDIIFGIVFVIILIKRRSQIAALAGIGCLLLAMPLYAKWIFFTAQRLVWFAAAFFSLALIIEVWNSRKGWKKA